MFEFATIYIRSLTGIVSTSIVMGYLGLVEPNIVVAYLAAVVGMVMLDKHAKE